MKKSVIIYFGVIFVLLITSIVNSLAWYPSAREANVEEALLNLKTELTM